jgi:flagellar basal body-associated protein FliL
METQEPAPLSSNKKKVLIYIMCGVVLLAIVGAILPESREFLSGAIKLILGSTVTF